MRILNFAHRGASHAAPENTLSAFRLAREMGADGIELDVQLSRDGTPVVMHDATVDRTTQGSGAVADLSLAELKELDAGSWFSAQFEGERIPTLAEVFEALSHDLVVNVELKATGSEPTGLEEVVVSLITRYGMAGLILISSFNPLTLRRIRQADPHLPLALLYGPSLPEAERERWVQDLQPLAALHPEHHLVDADHVAWARGHGCRVNAWTVDATGEMRRLLALGIGGIITNRPDRLGAVLAKRGKRDNAEPE
jgi:glycerophosphoryl diester phosphodiesterase